MGAQNTFGSATKELLVLLPGIQDSSHDFSWEMRHGRKMNTSFWKKSLRFFQKSLTFSKTAPTFFKMALTF